MPFLINEREKIIETAKNRECGIEIGCSEGKQRCKGTRRTIRKMGRKRTISSWGSSFGERGEEEDQRKRRRTARGGVREERGTSGGDREV